jgi:hypothetical protein
MPTIYNAREYPISEEVVSGSADRAYIALRVKCSKLSEARPSNTRPDKATYILCVRTALP